MSIVLHDGSASVSEEAYAKINLFLSVGSRRPDGFHTVDTVLQTVSLCDTLHLSRANDISLAVFNASLPENADNLAWRAADAFFRYSGIRSGVHMALYKTIPAGAGLGGGSADAAAVLRGLNRLYDTGFSPSILCEIAASLGADVPFCISGGLCRGTDRGQVLCPYPSAKLPPQCVFVLAIGKETISTGWAYGQLDRGTLPFSDASLRIPDASTSDAFTPDDASTPDSLITEQVPSDMLSANGLLRVLSRPDCSVHAVANQLYNRFEDAIFPAYPNIAALVGQMESLGAAGAIMSGSGAAVFGLFDDTARAEAACNALLSKGYRAWVAYPVGTAL